MLASLVPTLPFLGSSFIHSESPQTNSGVQLLYGRIYKFHSTIWVFLISNSIFEIGSLICGVAPSSIVLIVGRAISGLGSAGVTSGSIMIMTVTVPLHKRPVYTGCFAAVFGLASVIGTLLGGVFTEKVSRENSNRPPPRTVRGIF